MKRMMQVGGWVAGVAVICGGENDLVKNISMMMMMIIIIMVIIMIIIMVIIMIVIMVIFMMIIVKRSDN